MFMMEVVGRDQNEEILGTMAYKTMTARFN